MRARLLDMGEVSAVRSQSLGRAVAATLEPSSEPVIVLVKPATPIVSVGGSAPVGSVVDLAFCRAERIPVVRSPRIEGVRFHGSGNLLLGLVAGVERAAELGLEVESGHWPERAARPITSVCAELGLDARVGDCGQVEIGGRAIARYEVTRQPAGLELSWETFIGLEPAEAQAEARALASSEGLSTEQRVELLTSTRTGFSAELAEPLGFAQIAEALVGAIETSFELELVPSMPTPAEMEAIYDWDERILVSELLDEPGRSGGGLSTYLM